MVRVRERMLFGALVAVSAVVLATSGGEASGAPPTTQDAGALDAGASSCTIVISGAIRAQLPCKAAWVTRAGIGEDGGMQTFSRLVIESTSGTPVVTTWIAFHEPPRIGWVYDYVDHAEVDAPPANWHTVGRPSSTLSLSSVRKVRADGGPAFELHGTFFTMVPETTGVRGPDVSVGIVF